MKNLLLTTFLLITLFSHSQYYYKDIVGTRETNDMIRKFVDNKVRSVTLTSFEEDGSITEGFLVQQQLIREPLVLRTITRTTGSDENVLVSYFDTQLRLIKTVDTAGAMVNSSTYEYDHKGNISTIRNWSVDSTNIILVEEVHEWLYDENGRATKMVRKKNKLVMDEIIFVYDENGNLAEEKTMKNGKVLDNLFYYYNDKNLMTDIVRFNERTQRLLPDYMFEYSPSGQVIQKITVPANSSDYLIWRYQFDQRGIRIKEALYNKYKQLVAKIEYAYSYY